MGYRVEWRYVGSKRCPVSHSWQTGRLDIISLMHYIYSAFIITNSTAKLVVYDKINILLFLISDERH